MPRRMIGSPWDNFLEEHLSSAISIQILCQEGRQERRAFRLLARSLRSQQRLYRTAAWFTIWGSLAIVVAMSAVIGYGAKSVLAGTLSVGSLVAFYGFVTQLFDPLSGASELYARAQKTFASIRQVQGAFALRPSVRSATDALKLSSQDTAEIKSLPQIEFGYSRNKELLHIPSLRILPGEQIAIAGENGAGKSTLVRLIARLYDPVSGEVRFGGEDIRNIHLKSLRHTVCYLPRDPVLFDGTIRSNLQFVRSAASEREIEDAIRLVGLSDLVRSLPDGLRQRIGPDGWQLSGWGASTPRPRESGSATTAGIDSGRGQLLHGSGGRTTYPSRTPAKPQVVDLHCHLTPAFYVFNF